MDSGEKVRLAEAAKWLFVAHTIGESGRKARGRLRLLFGKKYLAVEMLDPVLRGLMLADFDNTVAEARAKKVNEERDRKRVSLGLQGALRHMAGWE